MIRTVLRIDALFEVALAGYLVIAVAVGRDAVRMADPASNGVLVAVAVVLAVAGGRSGGLRCTPTARPSWRWPP